MKRPICAPAPRPAAPRNDAIARPSARQPRYRLPLKRLPTPTAPRAPRGAPAVRQHALRAAARGAHTRPAPRHQPLWPKSLNPRDGIRSQKGITAAAGFLRAPLQSVEARVSRRAASGPPSGPSAPGRPARACHKLAGCRPQRGTLKGRSESVAFPPHPVSHPTSRAPNSGSHSIISLRHGASERARARPSGQATSSPPLAKPGLL